MKRFEKLLIQLAIVHFILLLIAQVCLEIPSFKMYTNQNIQYEGVVKGEKKPALETIDR
ncbi:DUF5359 family protein [Fictibacillus phosphorivorans]|uniref:DUF5359 family protein n=1 Tax=Fictibacillus phosphorivorans TaxID=1221500 RepID=UPI00203B4556|nr:DUF5359 family protein [Fictibacillus phosphorivorans]MCM3718952.1 YpfB family protein [Fictibacillus phosphorivorans]MCM3776574.1 YpfB family protein [Fictibacillus phosphorivorans]